ncbi:MAG: hypothetical protein QN168_07180 [Armatimonadota bacterium]|nr:hypothetical protein [Armatimonadota bacterium]
MSEEKSREEKLAEIRARVEALRKARAEGSPAASAPATPAAPSAPAETAARAASPGDAATVVASPAATPESAGKTEEGAELSREEKLAQIRARAEALRAARAGGATPAAAPTRPAPAKPAAAGFDVPVSSINPGGRPATPPQRPVLEAYGTLNQSVEIRGDPAEHENLKKLLGGLGAYQNPLRRGAWQIDYRYYAEARRRLQAAGYTVTEQDHLGRPLAAWSPVARGWTRVEP